MFIDVYAIFMANHQDAVDKEEKSTSTFFQHSAFDTTFEHPPRLFSRVVIVLCLRWIICLICDCFSSVYRLGAKESIWTGHELSQ